MRGSARVAVGLVYQFCAAIACADALRPGEVDTGRGDYWAFKLTPAYYTTTDQADAVDLNLRANHGPHAVWLGYYRRGSEFEQARTGYEYSAALPFGKLVSSIFLASRGMAGGALNAEIGDAVYGLLGLGRTNLGEYYNLNFDPNDSVVFGLGTRLPARTNLALYRVQDNRLHTGQRVTHLAWRHQVDDRQRLTVDLSVKHGSLTPDSEAVSGKALSLTWDYMDFFVRLAWDGKVNFTPDDMRRVSIGMRF